MSPNRKRQASPPDVAAAAEQIGAAEVAVSKLTRRPESIEDPSLLTRELLHLVDDLADVRRRLLVLFEPSNV